MENGSRALTRFVSKGGTHDQTVIQKMDFFISKKFHPDKDLGEMEFQS